MHAAEEPVPAARLWALPLAAGLAPAFAIAAAFAISIADNLVPSCNPLIDGCVSISRAARHGLGNHVFRALVLPAAALQALTWLLCAVWLRRLGATGSSLAWMPWLGVLAAIFLVLYGTFLGTEGAAYRWMRRHGVIVYFGFTYLCTLLTASRLRTLVRSHGLRVPARLDLVLLTLAAATLLAGLASVFIAPLFGDGDLKNRIENLLEWYAGLSFTLFFCALAWLWRHTSFSASMQVK
jgi:hypothetical protein